MTFGPLARYRARFPGNSLFSGIRWDIARFGAFWAIKLMFRVRYVGAHRLPKTGPLLIIANHQSFLDPPIVGVACSPLHLDFIARGGLFSNKRFGALIAALNSIPIKEDGGDTAAMKEALRRLGQGRCVLIFPEGSRTFDGSLTEFKRGAAVLLKRAGCPVLPVGIDGAFDAWPRTRKWPRAFATRVACVVGTPIPHKELLAGGADDALRRLECEVDTLRLEARRLLRRGTHGRYPPPGPADEPSVPRR